jgi:hypothetical protein
MSPSVVWIDLRAPSFNLGTYFDMSSNYMATIILGVAGDSTHLFSVEDCLKVQGTAFQLHGRQRDCVSACQRRHRIFTFCELKMLDRGCPID